MKKMLTAIALLVLGLSCNEGSSPTAPAPRATVDALVVDATTGAGIAGALLEGGHGEPGTVTTATVAQASAKTDATGHAQISIAPGASWARVIPPAGYAYPPIAPTGPVAYASLENGGSFGMKITLIWSGN